MAWAFFKKNYLYETAIHVQFLKTQKVAICKSFMQLCGQIGRLRLWQVIRYFPIDPNWGILYFGIVIAPPTDEHF
jgi:hypothetical protein